VEYDAIMKYGLLLILLIGTIAQAQVYRTFDKNGNVIYTDVEDDNAEEIIIDIAPSYTAPVILPSFTPEEESLEDEVVIEPKYKVSISSPAQNESFQNPESISVTASISPELNLIRADKLLFKLDGKKVDKASTSTSITLTEIERGSHILVVSVVDKTGKVLKKSKSILFHVHRQSVAH